LEIRGAGFRQHEDLLMLLRSGFSLWKTDRAESDGGFLLHRV